MSSNSQSPHVPDLHVSLASGARMPLLGFGTWQIRGSEATDATRAALEAGYRHLDTATVYGNEAEVGAGLRDSGVSRDDVFITTKFPPNAAGAEIDTLRRSLQLLGIDYLDLWLIHWPGEAGANLSIWQSFGDAKAAGLVRDIGVSNFDVSMIDELGSVVGTTPTVNQIEWSPLLFDAAVVEAHRARGVAVEGYSALRGGTLDHPTIMEIAERVERTTAQVIIRWHLQHEIIVIPKSRNADRIRSNADVGDFELSTEDMAALDALGGSAGA
jgi:diketogulonate reductase-like aldo/keto reductase